MNQLKRAANISNPEREGKNTRVFWRDCRYADRECAWEYGSYLAAAAYDMEWGIGK